MGKGISADRAGPDAGHPSGRAREVPTTGMRGGLGRTLLTAFLILAILPLTLVGGYAARQNRQSLESEIQQRLSVTATLKGEALERWLRELEAMLEISLAWVGDGSAADWAAWWETLSAQAPELLGLEVTTLQGERVWSAGGCPFEAYPTGLRDADDRLWATFAPRPEESFVFLSIPRAALSYRFCLDGQALERRLHSAAYIGETAEVALIHRGCLWPEGTVCAHGAEEGAVAQPPSLQRTAGIAASYALPGYDLTILVEQEWTELLASNDRIAAALIALILAAAMVTTVIAAIVIRQITRPVIDLTESAVAMAEGNLEQHLAVRSRDEIGILTYVFNQMAADLKSLYDDLEAKVVERTERLQRANYQIQRRALHLQASQEVSQAITSLRDPAQLLRRVADLIRECFVYASVAVYLVEPGGGVARLRVFSPRGTESRIEDAPATGPWPERCIAGDGTVVERAIRKQAPQVEAEAVESEYEWYRRATCRVAVPLRMEEKVLGAIAVLSTERESIHDDELEILGVLANQVAIALENARAYERERMAAQRLEEAEAFKTRFLANMSHDLREPLNTIIGFSRLLIKGLDGELNPQQRQDVEQIHRDSQRLLYLINDILTISQLQAGLVELRFEPVDLRAMVQGVLATADALIRGKDIRLLTDIPDDLPFVRADPSRLRQVLVHLLNNAARFTDRGHIMLRAWAHEGQVYVSLSDTGIGIPREDRERIFNRFERVGGGDQRSGRGVGLGLALSREFVELHGGQIWVDSEVGVGTTFTFSLPSYLDFEDERHAALAALDTPAPAAARRGE